MNTPFRLSSDNAAEGSLAGLAARAGDTDNVLSTALCWETDGAGENCTAGDPSSGGVFLRVETYPRRAGTLRGMSGEKWRTIDAMSSNCALDV